MFAMACIDRQRELDDEKRRKWEERRSTIAQRQLKRQQKRQQRQQLQQLQQRAEKQEEKQDEHEEASQ